MFMTESSTVELKQEYTPELKKEIVAFANSQGGIIYVGVTDVGEIVGVESTDSVLLQIVSTIRDSIKPDVTMFADCTVEMSQGHRIVKISVQRGTDRPYYLAEKGLRPAGVYVRQGTASVPASDTAIRQMIKETDGDKYEEVRSMNQDLTFVYTAMDFRKRQLDFAESQLKTLGLQGFDGLYTNLGLLLSDQCTHGVKVAIFEGIEKGVFRDRREFGGPLLQQLTETYAYIDLFNRTRATFSGLDRIDYRDYPEESLREALTNAIVHREYSFSGSLLVNIFDDRMEFISLGGLVPGLTMDDIMLGVSQARNENLANVFYRLKHIEGYGTGIAKMMSGYRTCSEKPTIKTTDSAFLVSLPNRNRKGAGNTELPNQEKTAKDSPQAEQVRQYLTAHGTMTRRDVEHLLGVKQSRAAGIIHNLVKAGLIRPVSSGKNTHYCLS